MSVKWDNKVYRTPIKKDVDSTTVEWNYDQIVHVPVITEQVIDELKTGFVTWHLYAYPQGAKSDDEVEASYSTDALELRISNMEGEFMEDQEGF